MGNYWRWLAVAAILLVVVPALWLSPTFEGCINAIPNYAAYQKQPEGLPFFIFFSGRLAGCLGPFIDHNANAIIAVFTLVLAWSTIGLWSVTARTLRHTQDDSRRQALDMSASISAANDSAWAAKLGIRNAKESSERQLRAYVSARPKELGFLPGGTKAKGKYIAHNHGQTPAYDVTFSGAIVICPYPLPTGFEFPEVMAEHAKGTIHPGAEYWGFAENKIAFTPEQIQQISMDDKYRVHFFTKITYTDAFAVRHETISCASMDGIAHIRVMIVGGTPNTPFIFENANQYNTAT